MKNVIYIGFTILLFIGCKQKTEQQTEEKELSVAEKIANAHGFEYWKNVSKITFNFNAKRHWTWSPKTNDVTLTTATDTISYNRKSVDSLSINADRAFVNDKFWLLIPFQLVWDKSASISEPIKKTIPIGKTELNKITLSYPNEGGYTPGDAYDIYFDDDYLIREWIFRRGNQKEPTLANTFENYQDFNGIKIALDHKNPENNWSLGFTDVHVVLE
ncbi:hypothetical protein WJN01_14545 [Flavobacteriaceae bacterium SZ-1-7]|uniref:hypothetical protein n=1 Tax=Tamlana sedimenti TaxID=3134126 RepID=UPI0031239380